jgi:hypothetical protein
MRSVLLLDLPGMTAHRLLPFGKVSYGLQAEKTLFKLSTAPSHISFVPFETKPQLFISWPRISNADFIAVISEKKVRSRGDG